MKASADTPKPAHGDQNRVLSEIQIEAIYKYVENSYQVGYEASKMMVLMAIGHLKAAEIPPKPQSSWLWFRTFMKAHPMFVLLLAITVSTHHELLVYLLLFL